MLLADYAVGSSDRDALEMTDTAALDGAGVRILTGTTVVTLNRTTNTVTLSTGERVPYDRLVLATGARANIPTLDGVKRLRRDRMRPPEDAVALDTADARLPHGVTVLRDLDDARRVLEAVQAKRRIIVLGAGVLGMELALAAAHAGAETAVVYHSESPMDRNLDVGGGAMLARAARRAGVTMINHSRAESVVCHVDEHGQNHFDAIICADGKQIDGDLLVLSCGVGARVELAYLAGLDVAGGVLVDENLRSWTDEDIYAIGDCAHVASRSADGSVPEGGPTGLIGPGWRQADWLADRFTADITAGHPIDAPGFVDRGASIVMLKADGVDVVAAGAVKRDVWDVGSGRGARSRVRLRERGRPGRTVGRPRARELREDGVAGRHPGGLRRGRDAAHRRRAHPPVRARQRAARRPLGAAALRRTGLRALLGARCVRARRDGVLVQRREPSARSPMLLPRANGRSPVSARRRVRAPDAVAARGASPTFSTTSPISKRRPNRSPRKSEPPHQASGRYSTLSPATGSARWDDREQIGSGETAQHARSLMRRRKCAGGRPGGCHQPGRGTARHGLGERRPVKRRKRPGQHPVDERTADGDEPHVGGERVARKAQHQGARLQPRQHERVPRSHPDAVEQQLGTERVQARPHVVGRTRGRSRPW